MKYTVRVEKDNIHVTLEGHFSFFDSRVFHQLLSSLGRCKGDLAIHMDLHFLESVDAAALTMLLKAHDMAKALHRPLIFQGAHGQVAHALMMASQYNALTMAA